MCSQIQTRDNINLNSITVCAFRNESNISVNKFNKLLFSLVPKVKDLSHSKLNLIDLNAQFRNNYDYVHSDGLHPPENVGKAIV